MVSNSRFRQLALGYKEVEELPHFEKTSFRVNNKIFATLHPEYNQGILKLSLVDQEMFSLDNEDAVVPVPNKWGKQGWTVIELSEVHEGVCIEMLRSAYCENAPMELADAYRHKI